MKIKRVKKCKKRLSLFVNKFDFKKPYRVITDIHFLLRALKFKIKIKEQLEKYLDGPVELITTKCVMDAIENGGDRLKGCAMIASSFSKWECIHKHKPVNAIKCIKSLVGETNPKNLFVASQSFDLSKLYENKKVPLLHITHNTIMIHKTTAGCTEQLQSSNLGSSLTELNQNSTVNQLTLGDRKALGILDKGTSTILPCKKKTKHPNPLSVKKPKKSSYSIKTPDMINTIAPSTVKVGKKRRKYKIASHILEAIKQKNSN